MFEWFLQHLGDMFIGFILLFLVILVLMKLNKGEKSGGCAGCAFSNGCVSSQHCANQPQSLEELEQILKEQDAQKK